MQITAKQMILLKVILVFMKQLKHLQIYGDASPTKKAPKKHKTVEASIPWPASYSVWHHVLSSLVHCQVFVFNFRQSSNVGVRQYVYRFHFRLPHTTFVTFLWQSLFGYASMGPFTTSGFRFFIVIFYLLCFWLKKRMVRLLASKLKHSRLGVKLVVCWWTCLLFAFAIPEVRKCVTPSSGAWRQELCHESISLCFLCFAWLDECLIYRLHVCCFGQVLLIRDIIVLFSVQDNFEVSLFLLLLALQAQGVLRNER